MGIGDSSRTRLLLFGGLYFAQGVPWGFVTFALAQQLLGAGADVAAIGRLTGAAALAWVAKPLLAPIVDKLSARGQLRPFLLAAEAAMALSLALLALTVPRQAQGAFVALVVVHGLCVATQDVGTDALALALLPSAERGRANGVMFAARSVGVVVGGPGLAVVGASAGWPAAYACAVALLLVPASLVLMAPTVRTTPAPRLVADAVRSFAAPAAALGALLALVVGASHYLLAPLVSWMLRLRLGFSAEQVSLLGTVGTATQAAGALAAGLLADRLGRPRAVAVGAAAVACGHLAYAACAPLWPRFGVQLGFQVVGGLAAGGLFAASVALFMDLTNRRAAATHFQIFMALQSLRGVWGSAVGSWLASSMSPPALVVTGAAVEAVALALVLLVARRPLAPGP